MSEHGKQMEGLKVEGDLVTSFYDSAGHMKDDILNEFLEEMKKDFEVVLSILHNTPNEMIVFFTYKLMLLKKLSASSNSFLNTVFLIKSLAKEINTNEENHQSY